MFDERKRGEGRKKEGVEEGRKRDDRRKEERKEGKERMTDFENSSKIISDRTVGRS